MVFESDYDQESSRLRINCMGSIYGPSIEDYDVVMSVVIDKLLEIKRVVRIVLVDRREYEYDFNEVKLLLEISNAIASIVNEKLISLKNITILDHDSETQERYEFLNKILIQIKYDPIEAYKNIIRELRHLRLQIDREKDENAKKCAEHYVNNTLNPMKSILEKTQMININKERIFEHKNRSLYREMFRPSVRPNFMYTRYIAESPSNAELVERYSLGDTDIEIYKIPNNTRMLYHFIPPEFKLNEEEYIILDKARRYIGRHEPRDTELTEIERLRENLNIISLDLLDDVSRESQISLSSESKKKLANILTRYTAGLGILEVLLQDEKVQDIAINSPIGVAPIYLYHETYGECETNMVPSIEDAESWATRFKLSSGRPLDEANPVLDTEVNVPGGRARVAAITAGLSPEGLGFAFRRHRLRPWTFPLFVNAGMMDSFTAGLLWFMIDGSRTILVGGTRGSGKSSLLGAMMVQIIPKLRIVTVEDTLELPIEQLKSIGYNIESLKSRSVITQVSTELAAEEALRAALRLGDSCLFIGEVRSKEAIALYEAMRIGALANVVAGTIHGDSAYGVYDRVVNDLGVPKTSFKATDLVLISNTLRSPDGLKSFRRVTELTEVRKHWQDDPQNENGFVKLLDYSSKEDMLKPSKTLSLGESVVLNDIASRVREWKNSWDNVWENINLRAKVMKEIVDYSKNPGKSFILEAPSIMQSNSVFHIKSSEVIKEVGSLDSKLIFERWKQWLQRN